MGAVGSHYRSVGGKQMLIEEMEWKEDFGIGVEIIDNAHQEFSRIVRRLLTATQQKAKNEWAA